MNSLELTNIIQQCVENDRKGQESLYKLFFGLFYTIAQGYMEHKEDAMAIVNESFLKIFLNIQKYDPAQSPFEVWAKRIVNNTCIDAYRKIKRQAIVSDLDPNVHVIGNVTFQNNNYDMALVENLFHRLPSTTSKVCQMYILEGRSHKEIAALLKITESTSRWHLREGKIRLKDWLEKQK